MPFSSQSRAIFFLLRLSPFLYYLISFRDLNVLAIDILKVWNKVRTGNTTQKCKFKLFLRNSSIYTSEK